MIKLYSFGANLNMPDPSPFVLKIDCYMRIANIEFENIPDFYNYKKAPKGKLPFIIDNRSTVADSEFIISYLQHKYHVNLDSHLSNEQKSLAYLIGKSLDENLYWCLVHSRWILDDTWPYVKNALFGTLPFPLTFIIPPIARKCVMNALKKQGLGRHSNEEIKTITRKTFQSLSVILADKSYFFGDKPSTFDATAFGFLSEFINVSLDNEFNDLAHEYKNLVEYCNNIRATYY